MKFSLAGRVLLWALGMCVQSAALADQGPLRIGLLTVRTGTLAAPGKQIEDGFRHFLAERKHRLGGRDVELIVADTGGQPALARSKAQELVERNRVDLLVGPLGSAEALAIDDYVRQAQVPLVSASALADDLTQRKHNPWLVRATSTASQMSHVLGEYAARTLGHRRVVTIAHDIAYGHEVVGGFQRVFEESGGRVVGKIWVPLNASEFGSYMARLRDADAVFASFSGSAAPAFLRAFREYGLKGRVPLLVSHSTVDESMLPQMAEDPVGVISVGHYSAALDNRVNRAYVQSFRRAHGVDPGFYSTGAYVAGLLIEQALQATSGDTADKQALARALRSVRLADSPRGPLRLDEYGNPVCSVYIRRTEMRDGRLQNVVLDTFPDRSQFWNDSPEKYLASPLYSRDFPPLRESAGTAQVGPEQVLNGLAFGGVLFLLSAGFSLIFGLMRIPNLSHGALFMLGAYAGLAFMRHGLGFWWAVLCAGLVVAVLGGLTERLLLRRLAANENAQVLATIGVAFILADAALVLWGGDPLRIPAPAPFDGSVDLAGWRFPTYRLVVVASALVVALLLWLLVERTRIGAMLRAAVDDAQMARGVGISVSWLFTLSFCLGAGLAGAGGMLAGPILSAYPGLDLEMLPLALLVVILGGIGSLAGALVGSFGVGLLYTIGQELLPDLAYVILFIPMVIVLALRPGGLFGKAPA